MTAPFADRVEAGQILAEHLLGYAGRPGLLVLGLPRGGVPVAAEIARALVAPLDVLVVRKLGLPGHEEVAMGALAGVGDAVELVRNEEVLSAEQVPESALADVRVRELAELRRRETLYRGDRPPAPVHGRLVIVVDDGLATGATMRAAVAALRRQAPARVVVAVPAGARSACETLRAVADEVVCARLPRPFRAVGQAYTDFSPTTDDEVLRVLSRR